METTATVTDEQLIERRLALKADLEYIQAGIDEIDDHFRERGVGTHAAGRWSVQVRSSRRLDARAVEAAYPVAQHPELYKPAIDTTALKDHIAPVDLDQFYVDNRPSIVVK